MLWHAGEKGLVMTSALPDLFDRTQLVRLRDRASASYGDFNFLKEMASERLADRLADVRRQFSYGLDVGCHDGTLFPHLKQTGKIAEMAHCDVSPAFLDGLSEDIETRLMTGEILPAQEGEFDLIASCLFLHWVTDLPGLLKQMRLALKPDGLLLVSLLGGRTLQELRACLSEAETEVSGGMRARCAPMADIRDIGGLMQRAGLAMPVADSDLITVDYPNIFRLMADLRGMGETNALVDRNKSFSRRDLFFRAGDIYQERYGTKAGTIPACFEIVTITGWAPDATQPKPLRPGSATNRLAEALGVVEQDPEDSTP